MSIPRVWKRPGGRVAGVACAAVLVCSLALAARVAVDPNRYLDDVKFLSSPELKGRSTGSPELEKAASWIANRFKESGLKTSLQAFPVTTEASLGKGNQLHINEGGHAESLKCPEEFVPFNFSSS